MICKNLHIFRIAKLGCWILFLFLSELALSRIRCKKTRINPVPVTVWPQRHKDRCFVGLWVGSKHKDCAWKLGLTSAKEYLKLLFAHSMEDLSLLYYSIATSPIFVKPQLHREEIMKEEANSRYQGKNQEKTEPKRNWYKVNYWIQSKAISLFHQKSKIWALTMRTKYAVQYQWMCLR